MSFWDDIWSWFSGGYKKVPGTSPKDYKNINPYTEKAYTSVQNAYNWNQSEASKYGGLASQLVSQALTAKYNPQSALNLFFGSVPQFQNLVMGATSPIEQMLREQTSRYTQQASADVANQFSGLGSLYSGAAMSTAAKQAENAAQDAAVKLGSQQLGLYNNLMGQMLPLSFQSTYQAARLPMEAALQGANIYRGMYSSDTGTMGYLGQSLANLGQQQWVAPKYQYQQGFLQSTLLPLAGAGVGMALGGPMGAYMGYNIGNSVGSNLRF